MEQEKDIYVDGNLLKYKVGDTFKDLDNRFHTITGAVKSLEGTIWYNSEFNDFMGIQSVKSWSEKQIDNLKEYYSMQDKINNLKLKNFNEEHFFNQHEKDIITDTLDKFGLGAMSDKLLESMCELASRRYKDLIIARDSIMIIDNANSVDALDEVSATEGVE